ncbi:MAG: glycosyl hydrolase [Patulibacter minatonensis]
MASTHPALRRAVRALLTLLLVATAVTTAGAATASAKPTFGYGEGRADMFSDQRFLALPLRDVRRLVEWDVQRYPAKIAALDTWMEAARTTGSRPLLAIDRSWTAGRERTKPSLDQYTALVRWLRTRYPFFNRLTPWNEANFRDQPTAKNPKLAWQYYVAAKSACAGCVVTSPVVLAGKSVSKTWLTQFKRYERGRIKIWAIHNYGDANRGENTGLKWLESQVKGRIWITEAAGWVQFLGGRYAYDERRAANAITRVIRTAKADRRIDFVYFYQWRGTDDRNARWDSGVLNEDGTPRLGYHALVRGLKG